MTNHTTPEGDRPVGRVDSRRRVTLPKGSAEPGGMFIIDVRENGDILLQRAVAVPIGSLGLDPTD